MSQKLVIFDCDDILWGLNEKASEMTGIDYSELVTFAINENPYLTDDDKKMLSAVYHSVELFENMKFYEGVERLKNINAKVIINSNSMSQAAADIKRMQLKAVTGLSDDQIVINIITPDNCKKKTIPEETFIFVDDSPHNIAMSPARYNIMMYKPWNSTRAAFKEIEGKEFQMYSTLNEIIDHVEYILESH
jgi:hypothetical protein